MNYNEADFYNPEVKAAFIETLDKMEASVCKTLFNSAAPIERKKKNDVANFSSEEITDMYRNCNIVSLATLSTMHRLLKKYIWFQNEENYFSAELINKNVLKELVNKVAIQAKVISSEELDNWEDMLVNKAIWNPSDIFIIRAVYEGVCETNSSEIMEIKLSDFYKKAGTWYIDRERIGKTVAIPVSQKLYDLAEESNRTYVYKYLYVNTTRPEKSHISARKMTGNNVIKESVQANYSKSNTANRIQKRFRHLREALDCEYITYKNIEFSGIINRLMRNAQDKNVPVMEYVYDPAYRDEITQCLSYYNKNIRNNLDKVKYYLKHFLDTK